VVSVAVGITASRHATAREEACSSAGERIEWRAGLQPIAAIPFGGDCPSARGELDSTDDSAAATRHCAGGSSTEGEPRDRRDAAIARCPYGIRPDFSAGESAPTHGGLASDVARGQRCEAGAKAKREIRWFRCC
jgi:hypothetical protein